MANQIQIKRKGDQSAPTGLLAGELAWSDNNAVSGNGGAVGFLYIGDLTTGTAVNRAIGGPGWGLELLDDSTLTGVPTAITTATSDDSIKIATTAWTRLWGVTLLDDTILTGNPTAPTASAGDNDTSVATTAYVDLAVAAHTTSTTQSQLNNSTSIATTAYVDAQVATEDTLAEMNDTTIASLANLDILQYTGSAWENKTISAAGIPTKGFTVAMAVALG